jgi:regulatory protein
MLMMVKQMIIKDIRKNKTPPGSKIVELDDITIIIDNQTLYKYQLKIGNEIDEHTMNELLLDYQRRKSMEFSYKYLAYKDRTESEVRSYLAKTGFQSDIIDECLSELKDKDIINDERFIKRYITKKRLSSVGRHRILSELKNKGIDISIATSFVDDISDEEEFQTAYAFIEKRIGNLTLEPNIKMKRKIAASLQRRGYSSSIIRKVLDEIIPEAIE